MRKDKIELKDILTKRERVERTLNFSPVDRVAIHDHILNPGVVSAYTGKKIDGFNYSLEDVCEATGKTMDMCRFPNAPLGTDRAADEDGFVAQRDNWTSWVVKRPFNDAESLREFCLREIDKIKNDEFDPGKERENYRRNFLRIQELVGETVIMNVSQAALESCWTRAGIDLFSYLYHDEPELVGEWLSTIIENEIRKVHAVADKELSPVMLVVGDFASKSESIFSPDFLRREYFPHLARLVEAWHSHGLKVLYHSDGNWKKLIPDLLGCGVDGFYCLELAVGMDIIKLKKSYPKVVWAGGLDGVNLMERGTPAEVRKEVRRQVEETDALNTGGLFLGTSSEINPMTKPENYRAMIDESISIRNKSFLETEGTQRKYGIRA